MGAENDAASGIHIAREILGANDHIAVTSQSSHGGAAAVLLDTAESASLLVVGNRGRGGFTRLLLGSTSHQCATHAVTPTAIVRALDDAILAITPNDRRVAANAARSYAMQFDRVDVFDRLTERIDAVQDSDLASAAASWSAAVACSTR